jgi:putative tricarboxylic transport membrane protein
MDTQQNAPQRASFAVKGPQDLIGGLVIIVVAAVVLWGLSHISTSRYQAISPTLFPRICAYLLAIGGFALVVRSFLYEGPQIEPTPLRGVGLVTIGVVLFGFLTPICGYAVAGFATMIVGGLASTEVRFRELVLVAVALTVFCVLLFTYGLGLSIPPLILPNFPG